MVADRRRRRYQGDRGGQVVGKHHVDAATRSTVKGSEDDDDPHEEWELLALETRRPETQALRDIRWPASLTTLNVTACALGPDGVRALILSLGGDSAPSITSLGLSDNNLGDIDPVFGALLEIRPRYYGLVGLYLSGCQAVGEAGVTAALEFLSEGDDGCKIEVLDLARCAGDPAQVTRLVGHHSSLRSLDLSLFASPLALSDFGLLEELVLCSTAAWLRPFGAAPTSPPSTSATAGARRGSSRPLA